MQTNKQLLDNLAISETEHSMILERLERVPNHLELGIFGSLWSEHCGYKHSKPLLKAFASDNPRLLVSAGEENAGVVDIGDGLAIVFKIESHNHPSAIEPHEGAATGVGGIVRDIFAMGARPIALLNSLRFGPIDDAKNRYLFDGVVAGISGYGNCIGIPNIGGEIVFEDSYSDNPLVNAMCIGLLREDDLMRATAGEEGSLLLLVGSGTGRDGIHGASGLASRSFDDDRELRPTVQVGNPFLEKVLIEACLEVAHSGLIEGLQDLGAAGLTSASIECAANSGSGIELYIDKVPRRDSGMEPYEVMLSETQERMLISVKPENLCCVQEVFNRWDVDCAVVGKTTADGRVKIYEHEELIGNLPIEVLTTPPLYSMHGAKPDHLEKLQNFDLNSVALPDMDPSGVLLDLLCSSNISSRHSVFRRYDHQVQTNTVIPPGHDGALLRVKGTNIGLAASTDGNGRLCFLDPYLGGMISVAEACRNVSCTGAKPIALTNCLNFGNPEKPDVYYQLQQCINGISEASEAFDSPIISGNVSLYNETRNEPIYPTPVIGAVGLTKNISRHCDIAFRNEGDRVFLLGDERVFGDPKDLAGSEYLSLVHGTVAGMPTIDIDLELAVQEVCRDLISLNVIKSAHDCSDGGLAVALAESAIAGDLGFSGNFKLQGRWDAGLFGEAQSRIIVSLGPEKVGTLKTMCDQRKVQFCSLGDVTLGKFMINNIIDLDMNLLQEKWSDSLEHIGRSS